ncbi:MAG: ribulose-phosphate 3-epimerase [Candidatus Cloacimonetes bacterium]|nr:ribulose-phosphate 3-epimerase [Candidatus Cloacimonadota bacterium]
MNTLVAASVLSADFSRLGEEITALAASDIIHLDLMDGHYVPNLSFGYPLVECVRKLTDKPLDAHLMVTNPDAYIDALAKIGVQWISFHQETVYHPHRLIQQIKAHGIKAGLALNPGTPVESISALLPDLDFVLVMSVNPGYSAQSFIPSAIDKIKTLNALRKDVNPSLLIEVDGGISASNSELLISAGADILVSASYIFKSANYTQAINSLKGI